MSEETKVSPEQAHMNECLRELNEVLQKYNMRLQPTFQLVPVSQPEEDEVIDSADEEAAVDEEAEAEETE